MASTGTADLVEAFVAGVGRDYTPPPELDAVLSDLVAAAHQSWSDLGIVDREFVMHLATRVAGEVDIPASLRRLQVADLYLAYGCIRQVPRALAAFERGPLAKVPRFIADIERSPSVVDEVTQIVRLRLLVDDGNSPAKLVQYGGRGSLDSWVCTVAVRTALSLLRSRGRDGVELDPADVDAHGGDPELALEADPALGVLRARHLDAFREAAAEALAALTAEDRNVLRLYFREQLSLQKIGSLLNVHASTVLRRLRDIRALVLAETRRLFCVRVRLSTAEFDSMAAALQEHLDLTMSGIFPREP
jgi:RNA polymerase sigma-70 factor, ECF subfamily